MDENSQGSKSYSEESSDTQMEKKKSLIQAEIIDKKYEIEEFTNFIKKVKGEEDINLSKWTIEEIKEMVEDFQHAKDSDKKKEQLNDITISEQIEHKTFEEQLTSDNEEPVEYISTVKQEKGFLSDYPNLTFQISNIEKVSGFFFMSNDYQFTIEVIELSSKVIRTMKDIQWLKDTFELYYPTTFIPPIPSFSLFSLSKPSYLKRKGNYIKMFLSCLSQNPLVLSSKLFVDFLNLSKEELRKLQNDYDESDPPTKIKKFPTMEGMISIATNNSKDTVAEYLRKNIASKSNSYIKLNKAIKEIISEFNVISAKMNNLSEAFNEIAREHSDIPFVQEVYTDFEELTKRYATSYLNQQKFFKEDLQQYFKYTNKMFNSFTSYVQDFENAKNEYLSQYVLHVSTLKRREAEKLDYLKKQYGYCLNRVLNEHNRLKKMSSDSLGFHLKNINAQKDKMFEDYLAFVSLLEGKRKIEELPLSVKSQQ